MKHRIGETSNGAEVYVELIGTEAGRQIARQPQLLSIAKEMLQHIAPPDADITLEYDMQRPIGYSSVITTTDQHTVFYGRVLKDAVFTRFVKNAQPLATRYVSVRLIRSHTGSYELNDIWIGRLRPAQPGSPAETSEGRRYWATHAIIYTDQQLHMNTITKVCPY